MQLVAYGKQDIYLTSKPEITFWKSVYRRCTNFAIESIVQDYRITPEYGNETNFVLTRDGDLINKMYLTLTLPALTLNGNTSSNDSVVLTFDHTKLADGLANINDGNGKTYFTAAWTEHVGHALIDEVGILIGGQLIDRHYGLWMEIWNELTVPESKQKGYDNMIGYKNRKELPYGAVTKRKLQIPLQFWFNRNPGLALPLVALQYHEIKINVKFREFTALPIVVINRSDTGNKISNRIDLNYVQGLRAQFKDNHRPSVVGNFVPKMQDLKLWVDYIYLDTPERRNFAMNEHEYLIEQLQYKGMEDTLQLEAANEIGNFLKLRYNHPVKEIIWCLQDPVSKCPQKSNGIYDMSKNAWFNFGYNKDDIVRFLGDNTNSITINAINSADMPLGTCGTNTDGKEHDWISREDRNGIQINGQNRIAPRGSEYFRYTQPLQHHTHVPDNQIYVYSFCLNPEEHQPSGSCNFSKLDEAQLQMYLSKNTGLTRSLKLAVFLTNYNIFRVTGGMGGLAFAN